MTGLFAPVHRFGEKKIERREKEGFMNIRLLPLFGKWIEMPAEDGLRWSRDDVEENRARVIGAALLHIVGGGGVLLRAGARHVLIVLPSI